MGIELNGPERELLVSLLERDFDELRSEIHHSKSHDFKESLKEREILVRNLLERLKA